MTTLGLPRKIASLVNAIVNTYSAGRKLRDSGLSVLRDDVFDWLLTNTRGSYSVKHVQFTMEEYIDSPYNTHEIVFELDEDAILFKLTWL